MRDGTGSSLMSGMSSSHLIFGWMDEFIPVFLFGWRDKDERDENYYLIAF
jgi:hypothetical protein